jgi:V/A-type H+/Na+-transporting ATPase subunit E
VSVKEGIAGIASEVLGDVEKEAEAILQEAESQAKETLTAAKQQAEQNYQSIVNKANVQAEAEKRKIASLTEVEIRNQLLQIKEELVDAAFEKAVEKLKAYVKTDQYHDYLLKVIVESAKKIGAKTLVVQVNDVDKAWLAKGSLDSLSKKIKITLNLPEQTENCIGGFKLQTSDAKIQYDNTIENRIEELKPKMRAEVAKILFGKET